MAFRAGSYWDLGRPVRQPTPAVGRSARGSSSSTASASRPAATSTPPPARSRPRPNVGAPPSRPTPVALATRLERRRVHRRVAESKPFTERPKAPFKTTTLQQEAGNKLGFSAGRTMSVAQGLYERGYITYMRTDSVSSRSRPSTRPRSADRRALRPGLPPAGAPHVRATRSRTRRRRTRRSARPATASAPPEQVRRRAQPRRAGALRADLDAHGRAPDDRRPRPQRSRCGSRARRARASRRSSARRPHLSSSSGSAWPTSTGATSPRPNGRRRGEPPAVVQGEAVACDGIAPRGPHHAAAGALHRGDAGEGARGPRHRPAVDVRVDHQHDHERRGYVWKKGNALVPVVDRVREDAAARALLRAPRRLRLHRHDGGGARRGRRGRGRGREVAPHASTSGTARRRGCRSSCPRSTSRRST